MSERLALSVVEAAFVLSVSERYMWTLVRSGRVRSLKLGRRRLIPYQWLTEDMLALAS